MKMGKDISATYIVRNNRLQKVVSEAMTKEETTQLVRNIENQIQEIKDEETVKHLKHQISMVCHEIHGIEGKTLDEVYCLCKKLHDILSILIPYVQTTKRSLKYVPLLVATLPVQHVLAATDSAAKIRGAFDQLMNVATAIAEPILWFYALTALIMMATGRNKTMGWTRLKNVGYSYIGITMLPTIFAFLRWISGILKVAFSQF